MELSLNCLFYFLLLSNVLTIQFKRDTPTQTASTQTKSTESNLKKDELGLPPDDEGEDDKLNEDTTQKDDDQYSSESYLQQTLQTMTQLLEHFISDSKEQNENFYKVQYWMACLLNKTSNKTEYFPIKKVKIVEKKRYLSEDKNLEIIYNVNNQVMKGYLTDGNSRCIGNYPQKSNSKMIRRFSLDDNSQIAIVYESLVYISNLNYDKDLISEKLWEKGKYFLSYIFYFGYYNEEISSANYSYLVSNSYIFSTISYFLYKVYDKIQTLQGSGEIIDYGDNKRSKCGRPPNKKNI